MARETKPKRIQICPHCTKSFAAYVSDDRTFCSKKCYTEAHRIMVICAGCDKEFNAKMSAKSRSKQHFCSHECYLAHKIRNRIIFEFACEQCGITYTRTRQQIAVHDRHRFCSRQCVNIWNKSNALAGNANPLHNSVSVPCSACGKMLTRQPYRLRYYKEQFCNTTCMGNWQSQHRVGHSSYSWKGGKVYYYGPNFQQQARSARKRDGYCCRKCGIHQSKLGKKLDVHHITPFRKFGYIHGKNDNYLKANALANLVSLCAKCHKQIEHGRASVQLPLPLP